MRKSYKKGFSLIELSIVLVIISILLGISIPFFSGVISILKQQELKRKFEEKKEMVVNSLNSLDNLIQLYPEVTKHNTKLFISDAFLKQFPSICYIDKQFLPYYEAEFFKVKTPSEEKLLPVFMVMKTKSSFSFKYDWENSFTVPDIIKSSDFYLLDSISKIKTKLKCKQPQAQISILKTDHHITHLPQAEYKAYYLKNYTLQVSSPFQLLTYKKPPDKIKLHLKEGINRIKFSLKDPLTDKEIYHRYDYILYKRPENKNCSIKNLTLKKCHTAPCSIQIQYQFDCSKHYSCIVDFGDGSYRYYPFCQDIKKIKHTYKEKGSFNLKFYIDDGTFSYGYEDFIEIETGNKKPYIGLEVKFFTQKDEKKAKVSFTVEDDQQVRCLVFYNGVIFTQFKECKSGYLQFSSPDVEEKLFGIVAIDEYGSKSVIVAPLGVINWVRSF